MGTVIAICAVMALATFAPEIFDTLLTAFRAGLRVLKSLWDRHA
jgi:hypothetical protein